MTIPMCIQENIRRLDADGVPGREIARRLGISRDSVTKYVSQADFSPTPPPARKRPAGSVLAGFTGLIDQWLDEDQRRPRKQRHTASRVFDRLVAEHDYAGSYSPVQRHVKRWREAHRSGGDGFNELAWPAGTAQVDFGQAEAIIAGIRMVLHVLVVTFPFSNMRFAQAYRGETAECITHGLRTIFEHVGAAPRDLIFDNATGAGRRSGSKIIESKLFSAFKLHYRCQARYCNPYSGHEKGNVENAVGFLRRNLMVPEPVAASLAGLNAGLLGQCDQLAAADHWRKGETIGDLFAHDVSASLELPGVGFDPVRYERRKADKLGNITIDSITYGAGPTWRSRMVTIGLRHDGVEVLDEDNQVVVSFTRSYDHQVSTVIDPASLLPLLVRKPGAWKQSLIRPMVPDPVADWLDAAKAPERRKLLSALDDTTTSAGFDAAIEAASQLISRGDAPDAGALGMVARRIAQGDHQKAPEVNLGVYDTLIAKGQPA